MAVLSGGQTVTVDWSKRDRYGRIVGKLILKGQDLGLVMALRARPEMTRVPVIMATITDDKASILECSAVITILNQAPGVHQGKPFFGRHHRDRFRAALNELAEELRS